MTKRLLLLLLLAACGALAVPRDKLRSVWAQLTGGDDANQAEEVAALEDEGFHLPPKPREPAAESTDPAAAPVGDDVGGIFPFQPFQPGGVGHDLESPLADGGEPALPQPQLPQPPLTPAPPLEIGGAPEVGPPSDPVQETDVAPLEAVDSAGSSTETPRELTADLGAGPPPPELAALPEAASPEPPVVAGPLDGDEPALADSEPPSLTAPSLTAPSLTAPALAEPAFDPFPVPEPNVADVGSDRPSGSGAETLANEPLAPPATSGEAGLDAADAESPPGNLVMFARQLVEMRVPDDWFVTEAAAGRDVRLVLSATEYRRALKQGMWITCHALQAPTGEALRKLLENRIAAVTRKRALNTTTRQIQCGGWPAVRGDFEIELAPAADASPVRFEGFHVLAPTPWALVEVHAMAPMEAGRDGRGTLERLLESISLREPAAWDQQTIAETQDAAEALGVWKSSHGRMRLFGSGRIDMEMDRVHLVATPASQQEAERLEQAGPPRLRGSYRASGDIIEIVWADGSRLNLRWKLGGGYLLLTDHEGQISKLKPLLE